jgi:sugar-specific transcriptional regulator TrmB
VENLKEFLGNIGMGKNESEIYCALVTQGTMSVLEISKTTKIHRSNVYDALATLMNAGLIIESEESKKRLFIARPPSVLAGYLKQKQTELVELIKHIIVKPTKYEENRVLLSKGRLAVREAIHGLLDSGKTICVYGIPSDAPEIIGSILTEFHKERIKKKILMRHIYNSEGAARARFLNKMKYTEARVLPSKYDSATTTNIVEGKVVLISWTRDLTVIEIRDSDVANSYRVYFELLWKMSKLPYYHPLSNH